MSKANSDGKMARCTLDSTQTISVMDMVLSFGLMVANILDYGRLVIRTVPVLSQHKMDTRGRVSFRMAIVSKCFANLRQMNVKEKMKMICKT